MTNDLNLSGLPALIAELGKDVNDCERQLSTEDSALARRNFTRAVFAWIEAVSFLMRQFVLYKLKEKPLTLEMLPKLVAASETTYNVGNDGEVHEDRLRSRTSNNLMFSIKSFAEIWDLKLDINKGGRNWQDYVKALQIRDRITHPKNAIDINITDQEVETIGEAKGMMIAYLKLLTNPELVKFIKDKIEHVKNTNMSLTITLDENDLKKYGID